MEEFMRSYGLWIVLAAVFLAMHWFGTGCGAGNDRASRKNDEPGQPNADDKPAAHSARGGGCH